MIFTYNKEFVGDVLMVIVANNEDAKLSVERKGNVARIFRQDTAETVAWNIFQVSDVLNIQQNGHLNICQVQVAADETLQIVAGAPNARLGLKTIVALPGAMMPKGNLIFPGELRGEKSFGMMCSPRELQLPNAPQKRGIIELADSEVVGTAFDPAKHWQG